MKQEPITINQGEPMGFELNAKNDEEQYVSSFEGESYEAMLTDECKHLVRGWSTEKGTITMGQRTQGGETIAYLSWSMNGMETSKLPQGEYSLEIAKVIDGDVEGRGIGILNRIILVKNARIKNGI